MDCQTDRIFMEYDQAITCGLIVNELVSNSIKYAFPAGKKGSIQVSLKHEGKKMRLEVADNGIGIKAKPKKKSKKAYVSLGLQLVDSLVTQLKNAAMKKSSGAKGTTFTITFTAEVIPKRKQTIK
jgi:two-component sensor histidine kinase